MVMTFVLHLLSHYNSIIELRAQFLLSHFEGLTIDFPESTLFSTMFAIDAAIVRRSETQLRPKQPRTEMATPLASSAPSTSAPSSLMGGVTLEVVMAQLQGMDVCLDTLSDELCQVKTHVSHIARQYACLGGFMASPSPSLEASENDEDASSSSDDEMTA